MIRKQNVRPQKPSLGFEIKKCLLWDSNPRSSDQHKSPTQEKLSDFSERMKQNRKEYEEKQRLKNEFSKKREKEIEDFMETDQYKDHNQFVSNELYKIIGVLLIILVFMKMFTSA